MGWENLAGNRKNLQRGDQRVGSSELRRVQALGLATRPAQGWPGEQGSALTSPDPGPHQAFTWTDSPAHYNGAPAMKSKPAREGKCPADLSPATGARTACAYSSWPAPSRGNETTGVVMRILRTSKAGSELAMKLRV